MSCDNCGTDQWVTDPSRGEMSCQACGLTMENMYVKPEPNLKRKTYDYQRHIDEQAEIFEFNLAIRRRAMELLHQFDTHRSKHGVPWVYAAFFALYLAQAELRNGLTLKEMLTRQAELDVHKFRSVRKRMLAVLPDCYTRVEDIIVLYCNSLDAPRYLAPMAQRIHQICQDFLIGREHETTATVCIALAAEASDVMISRSDIATVALIAQSTIDTVCRNIKRQLDPILSPTQIDRIKSFAR